MTRQYKRKGPMKAPDRRVSKIIENREFMMNMLAQSTIGIIMQVSVPIQFLSPLKIQALSRTIMFTLKYLHEDGKFSWDELYSTITKIINEEVKEDLTLRDHVIEQINKTFDAILRPGDINFLLKSFDVGITDAAGEVSVH